MPRPISTAIDYLMQDAQNDTFKDTCTIGVFSSSQDSFGGITGSYTNVNNVPCGFSYGTSEEAEIGQPIILTSQAVLRLNLNQAITVNDRVTVRGKTFEVDGIPVNGVTVKIVNLKELSTND